MAWVPLANVHAEPGANGGTTPPADTTGANLLVVCVSSEATGTVTDSKGNTWTPRTRFTSNFLGCQIFDCINPASVGAGHTFTFTTVNGFPVIMAAAFSGSPGAFDGESGAAAGAVTTISPGAVTPTGAGALLVSVVSINSGGIASGAKSINASFTIIDDVELGAGNNDAGGDAYFEQGAAAPINPAWSWPTVSLFAVTSIAVYSTTPTFTATATAESGGAAAAASATATPPVFTAGVQATTGGPAAAATATAAPPTFTASAACTVGGAAAAASATATGPVFTCTVANVIGGTASAASATFGRHLVYTGIPQIAAAQSPRIRAR